MRLISSPLILLVTIYRKIISTPVCREKIVEFYSIEEIFKTGKCEQLRALIHLSENIDIFNWIRK